jgi:hypothetical protein
MRSKFPSPNGIEILLDDRRKAVEQERDQIFDWDSIKDSPDRLQ